MYHNIIYVVGDASNFSLYFDLRCGNSSLIELLGSDCFNIFGHPKDYTLFILLNGTHWCWPNSLKVLNLNYFKFILNIFPSNGRDTILWNDKKTFNSKLVVNSLFSHLHDVDWFKGIFFNCFALNYSLFRVMSITAISILCKSIEESHNHLFLSVLFLWSSWETLIPMKKIFFFMLISNKSSITLNILSIKLLGILTTLLLPS